MTDLQRMEAIQDAIEIIGSNRRKIAHLSGAVWGKLDRAEMHLNKQMKELLAEETEVTA